MTSEAYASLSAARDEFRGLVRSWNAGHRYLRKAQEALREERGYSDYRVETPIVYNRALDEVGPADEPSVVLVADNPGKREQLEANNRYLVGQSGKLAESWFRRELGLDFRREVLILNKTPVHTPKTAELAILARLSRGDRERLASLLAESQAAMADIAWRLYLALRAGARASSSAARPVALWISGLGELRRGGLFETYRDELGSRLAEAAAEEREGVWAFNHFSMNQFAIELKRKARPGAPLLAELGRIGRENRVRVFGR
jgi:hypothetical protein